MIVSISPRSSSPRYTSEVSTRTCGSVRCALCAEPVKRADAIDLVVGNNDLAVNLLDQQQRHADGAKCLCVAVVIDLFSRRVVGWSPSTSLRTGMSDTMTAQLVTDALIIAIWRRGKPDALLHHSDQGSQYTSEQFQRLMADNGVTCSMSWSGNVWDNAAMESFFSSMKTERIRPPRRRRYRRARYCPPSAARWPRIPGMTSGRRRTPSQA